MEKANKVRTATNGQLCFFGGIGICLYSVVLIMNKGVIGRCLTFPFTYFLGSISYLIYFLLFGLGIYLLFKEKGLKIKLTYRLIAYILIFLSVLMIASLSAFKQYSAELLDKSFNYGNRVFKTCILNGKTYEDTILKEYFNKDANIKVLGGGSLLGGGAIGYGLVHSLNMVNKNLAVVVIVFMLLIALAIIAVPILYKKFKGKEMNMNLPKFKFKKREKKVRPAKVQEISTGDDEEVKPVRRVESKPKKPQVTNYDVIRNANTYNSRRSEIQGAPETEAEPVAIENAFYQNSSETYSNVGVFIPSHFRRSGQSQPVQPMSSQSTLIQQEEVKTVSAVDMILESNIQQTYQEKELVRQQVQSSNYNQPVIESVPEVNPYVQPAPQVQPVQNNEQSSFFRAPEWEDPKQNIVEIIPENVIQSQKTQVVADVVPNKPRKEPVKWVAPSTELLKVHDASDAAELNSRVAMERAEIINQSFLDYGIDAQIIDYTIGPSVTRYNVTYGTRTKSSAVKQVVDDIAIRLGGTNARFEAVVEGKTTSGIEIPNAKITTVSFKEVFDALPDSKKKPTYVAFGKNIEGRVISADLAEFPHALIAGTTGSGKSVFVNSIICTLIMRNSPDNLKLVLIDPKKVEFGKYKEMPHLLCKIINEPVEAKNLLLKLVDEMNERYGLFENSPTGATNIGEYNSDAEKLNVDKLPYIVVVIDEYADLVDQCKDISMPVISLAQKARACGIHILLATQRPSVNVVTGVLKGNLPTHVALSVASYTDSNVIIGEAGAEKLMGKGDMLAQSPLISRNGAVRLQSCYIDREEIMHIVGYLKEHYETHYDEKYLDLTDKAEEDGESYVASPEFKSSGEAGEEAKYREIKDWVMSQNFMSISRIQRECGVGFNRAGRFFIRLQNEGVVATENDGNKGCPVLLQNKFGDVDDSPVTSVDQTDFRR